MLMIWFIFIFITALFSLKNCFSLITCNLLISTSKKHTLNLFYTSKIHFTSDSFQIFNHGGEWASTATGTGTTATRRPTTAGLRQRPGLSTGGTTSAAQLLHPFKSFMGFVSILNLESLILVFVFNKELICLRNYMKCLERWIYLKKLIKVSFFLFFNIYLKGMSLFPLLDLFINPVFFLKKNGFLYKIFMWVLCRIVWIATFFSLG